MTEPNAPARPVRWTGGVDVLVAVTLLALVVAMFYQWLSVYFQLGYGPRPVPSASETVAYRITAGVAIALGLTGFVFAIRRRRRIAIVGYLLIGTLVIPSALLFAVPTIDVTPLIHPQQPAVENDDYVPCYGDEPVNTPGCAGG
ncbi:hypothetical protein GCM10027413_28330 [Conyzicola nivalis]|uniref:Uncharacterized protein n=1 Tax=Conyzicola nivalis TaxID=1477021 RepID=A0A916SUE6_9MICO|nr:hypothetical protein [Conyzicola nivalis]GGB14423.1 hypothetical protein GCM10010979_31180 [Conyzicola nivalis]